MSYQDDRITAIPAPLPTDYDRQVNFTDYQTANPGRPIRGTDLDLEFNAVEQALDETQARARLIQRDDGALANESVGLDQLKGEARIGVNPPTEWAPETPYTKSDTVVLDNEAWYVATQSHVSSESFQDDLNEGLWEVLIDVTPLTERAETAAQSAEEDATATGADRVQTGLDRVATGEDATATAADRVQTGLDRVATGEDATATAADRAQTGLDRIATGEDRLAAESAAESAARDAQIYPDTATALASTTEGDYFSVPAAEDAEAFIIYRHDAGPTATEVKRTPAAGYADDAALGGSREYTEPNLFPDVTLTDPSVFSAYTNALTLGVANGRRCFILSGNDGANIGAAYIDYPAAIFSQDVFSASVYIEQAPVVSGELRRVFVQQRDSSGAELSRETFTIPDQGISKPTLVAFPDLPLHPDCEVVRTYYDAGDTGSVAFSRPVICDGPSPFYRGPMPVKPGAVSAIEEGLSDLDQEIKEVGDRVSLAAARRAPFLGNLLDIPAIFNTPKTMIVDQSFDGGSVAVRPAYPQDIAGNSATKTTYYVGYPGASNLNDGLTKENSKYDLGLLLSEISPSTDVEIILGPGSSGTGIWHRFESPTAETWAHNYSLSIKGEQPVFLTTAEPPADLSWSADGDAWVASRTAVESVFDAASLDYRGLPAPLLEVSSVAECQSTPGSWYSDGSSVWVRNYDDRQPDNLDMIMISIGGGFTVRVNGGIEFYCENVRWGQVNPGAGDHDGLTVSTDVGDTGYATFKNCAFFGAAENGLDVDRVTVCWVENCTAAYNGLDGFNYHDNPGAPQSRVYEVGCHGYRNGEGAASESQNGSTAHDGLTIFRANCVHYETFGPCIVDVNGCYSFNINCFGGRSTRSPGSTAASFFFNDTGAATPGETWLVGCGASDSYYDLSSSGTAKINVRAWQGERNFNPSTVVTPF